MPETPVSGIFFDIIRQTMSNDRKPSLFRTPAARGGHAA
jgi:hypothetical protein